MVQVRGLRRCAGQWALLLAIAGCASPGVATDDDGSCTAGMACNSGNPGDCAAGHITCVGGKGICMPDVSEQACYGGEPETSHRGSCHTGKQSCLGKIGECMGVQLPVAENCYNNVDDDCDGHVNNGCPTALIVGDPDPLVARGGTGGNVTGSMCPAGSLVTGVQVQLSANNVSPGYIISVQPTCATPSLMRGANSYSIALTAADSPLPMAGSDAARAGFSHVTCAGGGVSLANGAQGSTQTSGRTVIESAGVDCANVTLSLDSDNKLVMTYAHDTMSSGTASVQVSGAVWNDTCAAGEVLVGFQGRTGAQMDQIQGICAPLTAKY